MDYYGILEISPDASQTEIKEAYRLQVQAWHPDKFPNQKQKDRAEERTKMLNEAYSTLSDPDKRAKYDVDRPKQKSRSSQSGSTKHQRQDQSKTEQERYQQKRTNYTRDDKTEAEKNREKAKQHQRQAAEDKQQRQRQKRKNSERNREAEAAKRWRQKAEEEINQSSKHAKKKPSFFKNLLNKGRCAIGAHKGEWIYDNPDYCTQVRICELCNEVSTDTQHRWREWQYQAYNACQRTRDCKRCREADYDTKHNWTHWEYLSERGCTQVQFCSRCKGYSDHTKVTHNWSEWSYNESSAVRTRTCHRCSKKMSKPITSINQPVEANYTVTRPVNLSGIWRGNDGTLVVYQQMGNEISMQGTDPFGRVIIFGKGTIFGRRLEHSYQLIDGTTGTASLEVSPDGRSMRGTTTNLVTGITQPVFISREA